MDAFEDATGVRLNATPDSPDLKAFLRWHPVGRTFPKVEIFDSTAEQTAALGGAVFVRVWHRDEPDLGVADRGLKVLTVERGPDAGQMYVAGNAQRANVDVSLSLDVDHVTPDAERAWKGLTRFLDHL